jgi:hypothetical protein
MRVLDADLTDDGMSYFPGTNALMYWNESLGADTSGTWVGPSLWDHGNSLAIAASEDIDQNGTLDIDDWGGYGGGMSTMPSMGMDVNGIMFVSFSTVVENISNGDQNFRHIYIVKSSDGGVSWSSSLDVTPHTLFDGELESVYGSMNTVVNNKIRIVYQRDGEPGTTLGADEDFVDNNEIVYLEIDTVGLFDGSFTLSIGPNEKSNGNSMNIFPNPAKNYTNIAISSDKTEKVTLTIVDLLGKEITKQEKVISSGVNTETINLSGYQNGIYFLNLQIGNKVTTRKLVITK